MILTRDQINMLHQCLEKYPDATEVYVTHKANGSSIGPDDVAEFRDRGNLFRQIAPKVLGTENITDTSLW